MIASPFIMKSSTTLLLLSSLFTVGHATAATGSFTSSASISIPTVTTTITPATPYPSSLNVSGLPGGISRMTVTLNGFSHTWPSDVDIMLVAPDGTSAIIFSDVGSDIDANSLTLTLDDSSPALLPSSSALTSGSYRPTNVGSGDVFSSPAPSPNSNVLLSSFNGISPNGTWNLFVMDDSVGDGGSIAGWTLNIETAATASEGDLVISEFRVRGTNGQHDEFVEIQNVTDTDILVMASSGTGFAVAASDGLARFVIPNNTIIPAGGHYLGTNSAAYSLSGHATGDATWTTDIPDNAGIALFRTSIGANFTLANRLDAVGSTSDPNTLYKRGTGYSALTPFSIDCSFTRDERGGFVRDTLNNEKDFLFVDTNGTSAGAGQRLGAPGPQNLASPIRKSTGPAITRRLVDSNAAFNAPPNRVRDFTSVPASNSTFGTLGLARRFTNNSGAPITRLRFRITDLSTFPTPSQVTDLRPRSAPSLVVDRVVGGQVLLQSTTLEQPPTQPNGGGFNSTLSVG
ncbi:MAG: lamin tail domain-containing protein, partial [Verrucomicrobiaceae bacterium]